MSTHTLLCQLDDIPDGDSCALVADIDDVSTSLIAVRKNKAVYVYKNSCPHIFAPLDFQPGRFLNLEKDLIQCAMHGALFTIEDGHCVQGPCIGKHLSDVAVFVKDNEVFLA